MVTYIVFQKLTDEGWKKIREAPQRTAQNVKAMDAVGVKMIGMYAISGEYDYISIVEAPNEDIGLPLLLSMNSTGLYKCVSVRAYPQQEFFEAINKMP